MSARNIDGAIGPSLRWSCQLEIGIFARSCARAACAGRLPSIPGRNGRTRAVADSSGQPRPGASRAHDSPVTGSPPDLCTPTPFSASVDHDGSGQHPKRGGASCAMPEDDRSRRPYHSRTRERSAPSPERRLRFGPIRASCRADRCRSSHAAGLPREPDRDRGLQSLAPARPEHRQLPSEAGDSRAGTTERWSNTAQPSGSENQGRGGVNRKGGAEVAPP